jgi:transitional endoplasmic reticulum ATPase
VFASQDSEEGNKQRAKGFINRLLEINQIPTFWITNSHSEMDAAVLRRFDIVVNLTTPPLETRGKIAAKYFETLGEPPRYLLDSNITSADIARITKVAKVVLEETKDINAVEMLSEEYLKLYSSHYEMLPPRGGAEIPYSPDLCNHTADLPELTAALKGHSAAILLLGPQGSGKGATAQYLGNQWGMVVRKSAADLVGQSTQSCVHLLKIWFERLRQEKAVGVLENADVLLDTATEISAVNAIVTDCLSGLLSRHTGVVCVCCTGPAKNLPVAFLNCFEIKIEFEALKTQQCLQYIAAVCCITGEVLAPEIRRRAAGLSGIVPQNFTTVLHRAKLLNRQVTPEYLVHELERDSAFIDGNSKKQVGFR